MTYEGLKLTWQRQAPQINNLWNILQFEIGENKLHAIIELYANASDANHLNTFENLCWWFGMIEQL